jgi:hypothetical protein
MAECDVPVLHEELNRLPENYRAPLMLCYLQGKTNEQAARQLGWPVGTVFTRLARGRDLLHSRLSRRGLTFSAGALGTVLAEKTASAALPTALLDTTLQVAQALVTAGSKTTAAVASANVAALTEGVIQTMLLSKVKIAAAMLAASLLLAGSGFLAFQALVAKEPPQAKKDAPSAEQFAKLQAMIKPQPGEFAWRDDIPWFTSIQEAREQAAKEGKPILIWVAADGQPLGSC